MEVYQDNGISPDMAKQNSLKRIGTQKMRVNCPNDVQNEGNSMTQKYRLKDEDHDSLENPADQDFLEISLSPDQSPVMGTIKDDLQFTFSRKPGKKTIMMPLVRNKESAKGTLPLFTNDENGLFSIRTLLVSPSKEMLEKTTFRLNWMFPGASVDGKTSDYPPLFNRLHQRREQVIPSQETVEDFVFSPRLNEGFMVSDQEAHLSDDVTWQDKMSDMHWTPSEKKMSKVFIALQHESTPKGILGAMPSKKMFERKSSNLWWDPKISLKQTTLRRIMEALPPYQEMSKVRIVDSRGGQGSSYLPTPEFHVRTDAPSEEPVFSGSVNQLNVRSIFGPTLTTKIATGVIYRNGRTPRFLRVTGEEKLTEMTMGERLPEEASEGKVSVTALNQKTITIPGVRHQIVISTPKKWASEINPIDRSLKVMLKHTTVITQTIGSPSNSNADVTFPKEEAMFSQSSHRLMPTKMLATTNKVQMTLTQNIHPMIKQRPVQLIPKDEDLEMKTIETLEDAPFPEQGLHRWNSQSIAGKMPTHIVIAETSHDYEVIPGKTLHPGRYAKSRTVESLGNEKDTTGYIRLVTNMNICPGSQGGFPCNHTTKDMSSPYNNHASGFTSHKLWHLRFTSNSARSGINGPSPKYIIDELTVTSPSINHNQNTGTDGDLSKVLNEITRSNYNGLYKNTLTTLGRPTIDSDGLVGLLSSNRITLSSKQTPDVAITGDISSLRSARNTGHLDILAVQHREPSLKGHHYIDNWPLPSVAHPLRVTVARSRSGGEIWRGDIVDLYQRLQDPNVQRLSQELEKKLIAQGAKKGAAHANRADLQKLSMRLMKALSRMRVRM
ncbi:hypothetical protein NDU88_000974 [Pleurodeles waltl]|uniref:Uncharacterized protein n=1 Tax=Pleurodeles waltl TaxID=8319 RepID=A0AAV7P9U8_PLEWA|nr:hypothetical protein NDU88_000974 [Pleurodeles waltl]